MQSIWRPILDDFRTTLPKKVAISWSAHAFSRADRQMRHGIPGCTDASEFKEAADHGLALAHSLGLELPYNLLQ